MHHQRVFHLPARTLGQALRALLCWLLACGVLLDASAAAPAAEAGALQARHQALQAQLKHNQFGRPLYLESNETGSSVQGDIYAVVDYPFAQVHGALTNPASWCDVLILHINTKYCHADVPQSSDNKHAAILSMRVGKKEEQQLEDTYRLDFHYRIDSDRSDYFDIRLDAEQGPLGTHDYQVRLEAITAGDGRSFLHLMYSYSYGLASRMAMRAYLATAGRSKAGFTQLDQSDGGTPRYISGMRGTVERNTMRYYLAIDAYLGALSLAPQQQFERRLQTWFNATEQYPRQLQELDRNTYLNMKRQEYARQMAGAAAH